MNLRKYGPSGWASVMIYLLPCYGVMICSERPLIIPRRRFRLPDG